MTDRERLDEATALLADALRNLPGQQTIQQAGTRRDIERWLSRAPAPEAEPVTPDGLPAPYLAGVSRAELSEAREALASDRETEKAFWSSATVDTFDLEECGSGYTSYRDMRLQTPGPFSHGEWVRADDFRAAVESAEATLADVQRCAHCPNPATCFGTYEGSGQDYACDDCCGHGCEDGKCVPLGVHCRQLRASLAAEQAARQIEKRAHERTWDLKKRAQDEHAETRAALAVADARQETARLTGMLDAAEQHVKILGAALLQTQRAWATWILDYMRPEDRDAHLDTPIVVLVLQYADCPVGQCYRCGERAPLKQIGNLEGKPEQVCAWEGGCKP